MMMRGVQIHSYGPSAAMALSSSLPVPTCGPSDLLVKVSFAGVNFIDTYLRSGVYKVNTFPFTLGKEGVGHIVGIGETVTQYQLGDKVAWPLFDGSYAEYVALPAVKAVKVPASVPDDVACAAMLQGLTAHYLVTSVHKIQPGDVAVVHAAAGGVGQLLTQMIKSRGGFVIATVGSHAKEAIARNAGADEVIVGYDHFAHKVKALTPGGLGAHVVYDGVGKDTFEESLNSLKRRGMMALFGGASGQVPPFDLQGLSARGSLFVTRPTLGDYIATPEELQWRCSEIFAEIAEGRVKYDIGKIYALEDVSTSHDDLEGRKTTGKLLLKIN